MKLSDLKLDYGSGCSGSVCGINAVCREVGGRPVCSCPPGYKGSPLSRCTRDECLDHSECAGHLSCVNGVSVTKFWINHCQYFSYTSISQACVNPCTSSCGINTNCEVSWSLIFILLNYRYNLVFSLYLILIFKYKQCAPNRVVFIL